MEYVPKAVSKSGRLIVVEILFLTMFLTFYIFHDISIRTVAEKTVTLVHKHY